MAKCSVCEHVRPCIAIEVLADDIAEILYNFYGTDPVIRTSGAGDLRRYIRAGNPLSLIVAEMLECDDNETPSLLPLSSCSLFALNMT